MRSVNLFRYVWALAKFEDRAVLNKWLKSIYPTMEECMSVKTIPDETVYLFSCERCRTGESLPSNFSGLKKIADSTGFFHCFILKVGEMSYNIRKGYYVFSPEKEIQQLTQEEGEEFFGKHNCLLFSEENKTSAPQPQREVRKPIQHRRQPGVVYYNDGFARFLDRRSASI